MSLYVIVENGIVYPNIYTTYALAVDAVKTKHKIMLDYAKEIELEEDLDPVNEVDVDENPSGETYLYIEKGIHIIISKLPIT